ncbi:MAG: hypothetical protein ACOYVF_10530 [Candidatus Zixiibacteriota bacterium]
MRNSLLSQIKILPADRIYPFEWFELKPTAIDCQLDDIPLIRNPFMVTPLNDEDYLLLGETALFRLLLAAGLKHIPVQLCSPDKVHLHARKLNLIKFNYIDLHGIEVKFPKHIVVSRQPRSFMAEYLPLHFNFQNSDPLWVYLRNSTLSGCPLPLDAIFRVIMARGRYTPFIDYCDYCEAVLKIDAPSGVVSLPPFSLDDLKSAALAERLYPPEVIKVYSDTRIVNVDFPVSVLGSDMPLAEKESFLRELISFRERSNKTAFFEGQVYILNL